MAFTKGLAAIKASVSCHSCQKGWHSECQYFRDMEEVNHNAFADEASSMVYFPPTCGCFLSDEERHYDYERDEGRIAAMKPDPPDTREAIHKTLTWEAHYTPYPALLRELGFDEILHRIESALDENGPLTRRWGQDIGLSGHFDRVVTFTISEPDVGRREPEEFQSSVGEFVAELGLEGYVMIHRVFSATRPIELSGEDEG